ncbi:hypothetical protein S40288_10590 [Stachybotrys chartarum IBT 40288]|nr:hypothetical protein S40288_10590 [Stachybotrys chartarum IBT 40288]
MSAKFEPVDAEAKAAEIRTFIHNHGDSAPHSERLSVFLALNELRVAAASHSDVSSIEDKLNEERAQLTIEQSRVEAENEKLQRELAKIAKDKEEFLAKLLAVDFAKLTELLARGCQTPAHSVGDDEARSACTLAGNGLSGNPNGLVMGSQSNLPQVATDAEHQDEAEDIGEATRNTSRTSLGSQANDGGKQNLQTMQAKGETLCAQVDFVTKRVKSLEVDLGRAEKYGFISSGEIAEKMDHIQNELADCLEQRDLISVSLRHQEDKIRRLEETVQAVGGSKRPRASDDNHILPDLKRQRPSEVGEDDVSLDLAIFSFPFCGIDPARQGPGREDGESAASAFGLFHQRDHMDRAEHLEDFWRRGSLNTWFCMVKTLESGWRSDMTSLSPDATCSVHPGKHCTHGMVKEVGGERLLVFVFRGVLRPGVSVSLAELPQRLAAGDFEIAKGVVERKAHIKGTMTAGSLNRVGYPRDSRFQVSLLGSPVLSRGQVVVRVERQLASQAQQMPRQFTAEQRLVYAKENSSVPCSPDPKPTCTPLFVCSSIFPTRFIFAPAIRRAGTKGPKLRMP